MKRSGSSIGFLASRTMCVLVGLAVVSGCAASSGDAGAPGGPAAAPKGTAAASSVDVTARRNTTNEHLMSLTKQQQARLLGTAVGESCVGKSAFFMGIGDNGSAFWSVRCADGRTYAVAIAADDAGTASVMKCATFKATAHVDCFKKF
jgi:hypothetical protein